MNYRRFKKKYTLWFVVLLFLISAGASIALLNKSQDLLSWDERSIGRAVVQLTIAQQSYLALLEQYQGGKATYEKVLAHYDLTWSSYETLIKGTKNAHFMNDSRLVVKLKEHFKKFQDTDPMETLLDGQRLVRALLVTRQAHTFIIELLHYEYQGISQERQKRDTDLVKLNKYIALSLLGVSLSAALFLFIIFRDKRRMAYLAYHDPLTQLHNRAALQEKITQLHHDKVDFCALLIDIDRFKLINDNYGHDIGDKLLIHITRSMSALCENENFLGRLGGDEFAIIYFTNHSAEKLAIALLSITESPIFIDGYRCDVGLSIGISHSRKVHEQWVDVLKDADDAMYQAKENGGNQYQIYASD